MSQLRVLALAGAFLLPLGAQASQDSRQLQALGLVEFHAGRYAKALELFDQAVAADDSDVYARYYRGVTRSRMGDTEGAIEDLRAVLAAQPGMDAAALDLGVLLVQTSHYRDAVPLLEQAQRNREFDAQASLFLGIAQLRLDEILAGRQNFARAAARDPALKTAATYYEGVANYREAYYDSAKEHFKAVVTDSPDSDIGREAKAFLAKIEQRDRPRLEGAGAVGFQYDSNVVLAPADITVVGLPTNQADGRATIDLNGTYGLWRGEDAELLIGYEFFQSLHFDLTDFNLTDNGPSLQLVGTTSVFNRAVDYGIAGRYDYYLLAGDNFLQEANAFPWIAVPEADWGRTEAFFRMRRRDFLDVNYRVRDGFNYATGVNQYVYVQAPDNYVSVGYRYDTDQPLAARPEEEANQYAYNGHQVSFGFGWMMPYQISSFAGYSYDRERYHPGPSDGRRDEIHTPTVLVSRPLSEYLTLIGAYFGTFNKSNDPLYNYNRQVGSIALEARF